MDLAHYGRHWSLRQQTTNCPPPTWWDALALRAASQLVMHTTSIPLQVLAKTECAHMQHQTKLMLVWAAAETNPRAITQKECVQRNGTVPANKTKQNIAKPKTNSTPYSFVLFVLAFVLVTCS